MATGHDSWRRNIRNLYESFQRTDEELKLLRDIDQAIIGMFDSSKPVEQIFLDSMQALARIHRLQAPGRCYVYVGEELLPLSPSDSRGELPPLKTPAIVRRFADKPDSELEVIGDGKHELFNQLPDVKTALLQPIYEAGERLLAVLLFADTVSDDGSRLADPEVAESVRTVAGQLSIAYDHFMRAEQEEHTSRLWQLFLNSDLKPTRCFKQLAEMAREASPSFGPLKMQVPPEIQILVLERDEDKEPHFLTIRGTTGEEPVITKIKIEESISGLLVQKGTAELEYFCDDPRKSKYSGVYKSYLSAEAGTEIKSEFAVRLIVNSEQGQRLVGVLNLESGSENAFNFHHRAAILDFADRIAPMVEVFEERIDHNRVMQLSVSSVTAKYLDSLASIFRHGVASPLLAFKGDVEAADSILSQQELGKNEVEKLEGIVGELRTIQDRVYEFTRDFGDEISGFGVTGRFDLRKLLDETVSLAKRSMLTTTEAKVDISLAGEEYAYAFCSRLFKQHFFSVLTNSIHSLQEKASESSVAPMIKVTIEPHADGDESQERDLNKRWLVRVWDNGTGVDDDTLGRLREFRPGNHFRPGAPGLGLGLVALQRYMGSIGGWVELEGRQGEFFEVRLLFDEYLDDIHGPLSILNGGAGDDG